MDNQSKDDLMSQLESLTKEMNVPEFRKTDFRWLLRNAAINNSENQNLEQVILICKSLARMV
jgi:hypothetical protein